MTVRTRVHRSADGWQLVRDELVDALAARGALHCPGAAGALLDVGHEPAGDTRGPGRTDSVPD